MNLRLYLLHGLLQEKDFVRGNLAVDFDDCRIPPPFFRILTKGPDSNDNP